MDPEVNALGPERSLMKIKSLSPFYWFFGLACGLLLGTSLGHETSVIVSKSVFFLSIAVITGFGKQIDAVLHNSNLQEWHFLRTQSKWLLRSYTIYPLTGNGFYHPFCPSVGFNGEVFRSRCSRFGHYGCCDRGHPHLFRSE